MFKTDLIQRMADRNPQLAFGDAQKAVNLLIDEIVLALATDERVTFQSFGSFDTRENGNRKARNPNTGEVIQIPPKRSIRFSPSKEMRERCDVVTYVNNGSLKAEMLVRMSVGADTYTLGQIVERKDCPRELSEQIILSLATSGDPARRIEAASRAKLLPADAIRSLCNDDDAKVRKALAISCPVEVLPILVLDADLEVRKAVAARDDLPEGIAITLATDRSAEVRSKLADYNRAFSVLSILATDPDVEVRGCVVGEQYFGEWSSRECPPEILSVMATDISPDIRALIAANEKCPESVLRQLVTDENENVREALLENEALPPDVLVLLASDNSVEIRSKLAWGDAPSEDILETFASDADIHVRVRVAGHKNCPESVLRKLSIDQESWVRNMVAYSKNCPIDLLSELSHDDSSDVRAEVAGNHRCPPTILSELSRDGSSNVRAAVAGNKGCPDAVLKMLSEDKDPAVFGPAVRTIRWR